MIQEENANSTHDVELLESVDIMKKKKYHDMPEEHLTTKIKEFLEGGKHFIVLDDVWTTRLEIFEKCFSQ